MSHRHPAGHRRGGSRASRRKRRLPSVALRWSAVAVLGTGPMIGGPGRPQPSTILCTGWAGCDRRGYDSYDYAARRSKSYWDMSPGDECTNYVAYVESAVFGAPRPRYRLGNAGQWAAAAAAHGVVVNHVPTAGAVAEWNGGAFGMGRLGHVAVVQKVGPHDSYIYISQQHIYTDVDGYDWTRINAGFPADKWQEWPDNFIHFPIRRRAFTAYHDAPLAGNRLG
jgi:surface antigen